MTTADYSEGADVQWSDGGYWIRSGPPLLHLRGAEYGARMLAELLAGAELNGRQVTKRGLVMGNLSFDFEGRTVIVTGAARGSPNAETRMVESIPPDKRAQLTAAIPLGRFAAPRETAAAVAFLASEEAGYLLGVMLPVDGGMSM